jgi:hypothetical protein
MRRRLPSLLAIAAALTAAAATACAPETRRAEVTDPADTTDSAGVTIVRGPATDDSLPWTFTEIGRLGGADTGAQAFDQASAYTVATDGQSRIAVLDARNDNRLHLFDAAGTHLRTVGGKGGGPGEMEFPQGVELGVDGRLGVVDAAKSALLRWDAQGTPLPEQRLDLGDRRVWGMVRLRGDTIFAAVDLIAETNAVRRLERWTATDTLRIDSTVGPKPVMTRFRCIGLALPPLFTGELTYDVGEDRVAVTHQSAYVIDIRRPGARLRSVRRDVAPVNATAADAVKLYPEGLTVSFSGGKCTTAATEVGEKLGVAPTLPMVRAIRFAPDGSLWVERYTFTGETPRTDVFDADGHYLGTVTGRSLPLGFLGPDTVLFAIPNEDDGTSVIGVFRITR